MANPVNSTTAQGRANLLNSAMSTANERLATFELVVRFVSQFPKRGADIAVYPAPIPIQLDERPDIELEMSCLRTWYPIDIVYLRQMPQEPEKLKSIEQLSAEIFNKAKDHLEALNILLIDGGSLRLTSVGTKINIAHLKTHKFTADSQGYMRVDGLRVVCKSNGGYMPIKESQLHSHTRIIPEELEGGVFNITDDFDKIRTDGKEGMFCVTKKADVVALERITPTRQIDAQGYAEGLYIPFVRTWEEVEQLSVGKSNFFNL